MPYPDKEHLFKPGQSGNPKGRPPGKSVSYHLKEIQEEIDADTGKTEGRLLAEKLQKMAKRGHSKAIDVVVDRTEGKLTQPVNLEEASINVTYTKEKDES